jgi:curved DNA-binding protein CbpA
MKLGRPHERSKVERPETSQLQPSGFLKRLGNKIGKFLLGSQKALPAGSQKATPGTQDLSYNLTITSEEAKLGTWVTIAIDRGQGQEKLKVRIPPGTPSGTRLRLTGKGKRRGNGSGHLYLTVNLD